MELSDFLETLKQKPEPSIDTLRNCLKTEFKTSQGEGDKTGFIALGPSTNPIVPKLRELFEDAFSFRVRYYENY